jgi:hypothetical protein
MERAMGTYEIVRNIHIVFGATALASYWGGALARKGSAVHKACGRVFLVSLALVVVLAVPMTGIIWRSQGPVLGTFLAYLIVITGTGAWQAWRAVRDKRDFRRYAGPVFRSLALLNVAAGLAVLVLGWRIGSPLFAGFSLVGVLGGVSMLRLAARGPSDPRWWLGEHLGAMLGNGVATHIAFLAIGLPRLVPQLATPSWNYVAWFGPLALSLVAQVWLRRKYLPPRPAVDQSQRSSRTNTAPASTLSGNLAVGS